MNSERCFIIHYQKELKKVKILVGIGISFSLFIIIGAGLKYGFDDLLEGSGLLLLCTTLYPLGVFYNWRNMFGIASVERDTTPADRYYTRQERDIYHSTNLMGRALLISIAFTLGWIPGVFHAYKKLNYLKKNEL